MKRGNPIQVTGESHFEWAFLVLEKLILPFSPLKYNFIYNSKYRLSLSIFDGADGKKCVRGEGWIMARSMT